MEKGRIMVYYGGNTGYYSEQYYIDVFNKAISDPRNDNTLLPDDFKDGRQDIDWLVHSLKFNIRFYNIRITQFIEDLLNSNDRDNLFLLYNMIKYEKEEDSMGL